MNDKGNLYFENFSFAIKQIKINNTLLILLIIEFFVLIFLNYSFISFTKITNATTRIVLGNHSSFIIWIFFILQIHKESYQKKFKISQFISFIILIIGVSIYYGIIGKEKDKKKEKDS